MHTVCTVIHTVHKHIVSVMYHTIREGIIESCYLVGSNYYGTCTFLRFIYMLLYQKDRD